MGERVRETHGPRGDRAVGLAGQQALLAGKATSPPTKAFLLVLRRVVAERQLPLISGNR
jgi:hypothetical protein